MKWTLLIVAAALFLTSLTGRLAAQDTQQTNTLTADLNGLMMKVHGKLQGGKHEEADFADELKQFDDLVQKHKEATPDELAQVLDRKAMLYQRVFKDDKKHQEILVQIAKDFPGSKQAKAAQEEAEMRKQQAEAEKIQATLVKGNKFPEFEVKDLQGNPLSIANYKGKVVLLDFWATWCGPCVGELPNVLKTYEKHHNEGFEIIGISLDGEQKRLESFIADRRIPWRQYFDGKGWGNKLAVKYGVVSIPQTYLLDGTGTIIGRDLRGEQLEEAVAGAVKQ
jgi:peroxiredoxin